MVFFSVNRVRGLTEETVFLFSGYCERNIATHV